MPSRAISLLARFAGRGGSLWFAARLPGRQIMVAFEKFLEEHPDMAETLRRRHGGLPKPRVSLPNDRLRVEARAHGT
jgi:hypothetical protein